MMNWKGSGLRGRVGFRVWSLGIVWALRFSLGPQTLKQLSEDLLQLIDFFALRDDGQ